MTDNQSPYSASSAPASSLGIDSPVTVRIETWTAPGAPDLATATAYFAKHAAVIAAPEMKLVDGNSTVGETLKPVLGDTVDTLNKYVDDPVIVKPKNYEAYNGTERKMYTVGYPNVMEYFKGVVTFQNTMLPTVRAIASDPTVEVSVDPDEGTVLNLQLFKMEAGNPTERQQHGAHTDRVDTTIVACLDNVGPGGDLVFANGYTEACKRMGLNPHVDFNKNLVQILADDPKNLVFRIHPVTQGAMVMINSARDVHFITPKTAADVTKGVESGKEPIKLTNDMVIGRAIINVAYETGVCRQIDEVAHKAEAYMAANPQPGASFHDRLNAALDAVMDKDVPAEWRDEIIGAVVARGSAVDLYSEKTPGQQA